MSSVSSIVLSSENDPHQWGNLRRWLIAFVVWNTIAPVELALTSYCGIEQQIQNDFHASESTVTLGVGFFNFGFLFGPSIAGPLSELYGRRPLYVTSTAGFAIILLFTALSPSIYALLVCRALAGLLGSAVFSLYGGSLSDMFNPKERAPLVAIFTIMLQGAPTLGPVTASLLSPYLPWRWLVGFMTIWAALIAGLVALVPETEPVAIQRILAKERGIVLKPSTQSTFHVLREALSRPITMLRHEPIVTWTTLCHAFVYGLLFLLLEAYPYVFGKLYSMTREETGLVFLAPCFGSLLGVVVYFIFLEPQHRARRNQVYFESSGKRIISPEERLPWVLLASVFTSVGMFWFALAARPDMPCTLAVLSGIPVGMGMSLIQLSLVNYYIDLYPTRSASVIAANSAVRNISAVVLPSMSVPLYSSMGIENANMALACLSSMGFPIALILLAYGKRLRARSRWATQEGIEEPYSDVPINSANAPLLGSHIARVYSASTL